MTPPWGTRATERRAVRERIRVLGKNSGYICGPDHHIKPDVPAANAVALFRAAREYRRDGYTTG